MEWIKYDKDNPPPEGRYLATDGRNIDILTWGSPYGSLEWEELECWVPETNVTYVAYYAELKLPMNG